MTVAIVLLLVLFLIGVPIAFALGIAPLLALMERNISLIILPQIIFESLDSFVLMAIPFFILAGRIMQAGGIAARLVELAIALTGWMRGGLASASVVTSMFFATMSGSSSATAAAVGSTLIPEMERRNYPRPFAAATIASSAELGAIIPPSVPMIVYALVAGVSITELFIAGILPGLMIGLSLIATVTVLSTFRAYGTIATVSPGEWLRNVGCAMRRASLSLLMPIIVLGGIYGGIFTPTEAAVVAVLYALFLSLVAYREIRLRDLPKIFSSAAVTSAIVTIIVAFAAVFAYALSIYQIPQALARGMREFSDNLLLMVNMLLLVVGMFIETLAAIVILGPILVPIALTFGIDPIHFAMIVVANLAIGMMTPPVGVNLFIVSNIANIRIESMVAPLLVFLCVLVGNLMVITYVPVVSTVLIR